MTRFELILSNILFFGLGLFIRNMIQQFNSFLNRKINDRAKINANEIDAFERMLASHHNFLLSNAGLKKNLEPKTIALLFKGGFKIEI